jgi:hypothetical protein
MTEFTESEHDTIRLGAFGAIALVSKADPGFFSTFKESMAGSKALAAAPESVRDLLRGGGFVSPPRGTPEQVDAEVLDTLRQATALLDARDPAAAAGYREVIRAASDAVANASKGVSDEERAVIARIEAALTAAVPADAAGPTADAALPPADSPA